MLLALLGLPSSWLMAQLMIKGGVSASFELAKGFSVDLITTLFLYIARLLFTGQASGKRGWKTPELNACLLSASFVCAMLPTCAKAPRRERMRIFSLADRPLKVTLHMHTNLSAGKLSPLLALQAYEDADYDAVAITDHRTITTVPDYQGDMLVLPGMEWDVNLNRGGEVIHLLGIGMAEGFSYERQRENDAQRFVDSVREAGGLCFFCHPHWSMNRVETLLP